MPDHDAPDRRRRDTAPDGGLARSRPPSQAAQQRLSGVLRDKAQAYHADATVDLTIMEALLRLDEPEAAAKALADHRETLRAMAADLQLAVADAAVEREAEQLCHTAASQLPAPRRRTGLRSRVLAGAGAAALAVALILPTGRFTPRTTLTSAHDGGSDEEAGAARERFEAARSWARALRADGAAQLRTRQVAAATTSDRAVPRPADLSLAADSTGGSAAPSVPSAPAVVDRHAGSAGAGAGHRPPTGSSGSGEPTAGTAEEPPPVKAPALPPTGGDTPLHQVPMQLDADDDGDGDSDGDIDGDLTAPPDL